MTHHVKVRPNYYGGGHSPLVHAPLPHSTHAVLASSFRISNWTSGIHKFLQTFKILRCIFGDFCILTNANRPTSPCCLYPTFQLVDKKLHVTYSAEELRVFICFSLILLLVCHTSSTANLNSVRSNCNYALRCILLVTCPQIILLTLMCIRLIFV